jgi:hypothetical protein
MVRYYAKQTLRLRLSCHLDMISMNNKTNQECLRPLSRSLAKRLACGPTIPILQRKGRDSTTATLLPNPTTTAAAAPAATAAATAANHSIEELPKDSEG